MIFKNIWMKVIGIVLIDISTLNIFPNNTFVCRILTKFARLHLAAASINGFYMKLCKFPNGFKFTDHILHKIIDE